MTKTFCDRCGSEANIVKVELWETSGHGGTEQKKWDLCLSCYGRLVATNDKFMQTRESLGSYMFGRD